MFLINIIIHITVPGIHNSANIHNIRFIKDLITSIVNQKYQKTEEYFNGVFVQYTVDTYIFFNLMTKVPSIHNEFEEFYKLYFEENFHDIQP